MPARTQAVALGSEPASGEYDELNRGSTPVPLIFHGGAYRLWIRVLSSPAAQGPHGVSAPTLSLGEILAALSTTLQVRSGLAPTSYTPACPGRFSSSDSIYCWAANFSKGLDPLVVAPRSSQARFSGPVMPNPKAACANPLWPLRLAPVAPNEVRVYSSELPGQTFHC